MTNFTLTVLFLTLSAACATIPEGWHPRWLAGAPEKAAAEDTGSGGLIVKCSAPEFADYSCLSNKDVRDLALKCNK